MAPPKKVRFPTVRTVLPQLISQQIVSVQPMTLPSGILFGLQTLYGRRRPVTSQKELNMLFQIWDLLQKKYPIGSIVHVDVGRIIHADGYYDDKGNPTTETVVVTSEFYVLSEKGSIGYLCDKSKDETDFYFADDLIEYSDVVKELNSENT